MSNNHRPRIDRAERVAREANRGAATIAEALGAKTGIHPGDIMAEAERLWHAAGPNPTSRRVAGIVAEETGRTVEDIEAEAAAMLAELPPPGPLHGKTPAAPSP